MLFLLPKQSGNPRFRRAFPWLCANFLINGTWLVVFQYEFYWFVPVGRHSVPLGRVACPSVPFALTQPARSLRPSPPSRLSCPIIATNLYFVYRAYDALRIGVTPKASLLERFCSAAVSTNLAWLLAATLVNITTTLYINGWAALGPAKGDDPNGVDWAVLLVALATTVAMAVVLRRGDYVYGAATLWALWGIYARQVAVPGTERLTGSIIMATVLIALATAATLLNRFIGGWWGPAAHSHRGSSSDKDVAAFTSALRALLSEQAQSDQPGAQARAARKAIRLGAVLARQAREAEEEEEEEAVDGEEKGVGGHCSPLVADS